MSRGQALAGDCGICHLVDGGLGLIGIYAGRLKVFHGREGALSFGNS